MRTLSLALTLAIALALSASAQQPDWESVTSKAGGFTVEMPTKPSFSRQRTRNGPGGKIQTLFIGCSTPGGVYLAYQIKLATPIVRGAEDTALNAERDAFAQEWNGKVISEKKVRAEGRLGRDFTIRGKPAEETGILTIRVREYLIGNAVYAVAVVSAPNRELPLDAGRFLGSLAIGTERKRAAGTPEPEPTGRQLEGWGLAIDTGKDCEFTPQEKKLTMRVPGTWHDLNPDTGKLNSPRVLREVEGDFVLKVKVEGEFKPAEKSTNPRGVPYNGAGIIIWSDSDNFIRLERGALLRRDKITATVAFEEREGGYRGAVHNITSQQGPVYLRLERKGSRISGAVSTDDSKWRVLKPIDTVWPAKLKVGLSAISSSGQPFVAEFTEYSLRTKAGKP
jgi:regulation of enolase protein 1 (concanavalin A-like superfamily)